MAQDLLYTDDGDLYISKDSPLYVTGLDEIKQSLNMILMTKKGTWSNENVGIDYDWLIGGFDRNACISSISDSIKQDKRIIDVVLVDPQINQNHTSVDIHIVVNTTLSQLDFWKEVKTDATN